MDASHALARSTTQIGSPSDRLRAVFSDGRIKPTELELLRSDIETVSSSLQELETIISVENSSVWVAPQITAAAKDIDSRLAPAFERSLEFEAISDALPSLLGFENPRSYLVLFGNPAEARELGGFTGATAVLTLNAGSFELETTGRRTGEDVSTTAAVLSEAPPVRFLEHRPWLFEQNYSAMADFPTLTRALADLVPAMGGDQIHGVVYLDPFALEALAALTGPIEIPSLGGSIAADDLPDLLLIDQYQEFSPGPERDAFFNQLLTGVAGALKSGDFDLNSDSARQLLRVIEQDRLLFAPLDPESLAAADSIGISGRIADLSTNDYLAISHLNSGGNKLDPYIERTATYDVQLDPANNTLHADVQINLHNTADLALPEYVLGRLNEEPGNARITLVVHSPHELVRWTGQSLEPELTRSFREFDRWRHEVVVHVGAAEEVSVGLVLSGSYAAEDYILDIGHQPLVNTDDLTIRWTTVDGVERRDITLTHDITIR